MPELVLYGIRLLAKQFLGTFLDIEVDQSAPQQSGQFDNNISTSGRWLGTSPYSCPGRRPPGAPSWTASCRLSPVWRPACHLLIRNILSPWRTSPRTTPATPGTPATPPPRARPLWATAVSQATSRQRTPSTTETPARAPPTRGYSGPWRRTKAGEWTKGAGSTLRRSSTNSWRTFNLITWLFRKVRPRTNCGAHLTPFPFRLRRVAALPRTWWQCEVWPTQHPRHRLSTCPHQQHIVISVLYCDQHSTISVIRHPYNTCNVQQLEMFCPISSVSACFILLCKIITMFVLTNSIVSQIIINCVELIESTLL